jgi:hypothetical protein
MYHLIRILLWTTVLTWAVSLYVGMDMIKLQFWGELTKGEIIWTQANDAQKCVFPKDVSVLLKINQTEYLEKWTPSKEICLKQPITLDFWIDPHQSPPKLIYANQLTSREMMAFNVQWISNLLLILLIFLSRIFKARYEAEHQHKHHHKHDHQRIAFFDFDKQDKLDDLLDDD